MRPELRISVLLTGTAPVAATSFTSEGLTVPILFRTGAPATGDDVIRAMLQRGPELNALLPLNRGMGLDARSGELVMLVRATDALRPDLPEIRARAEALTGVKVRFDPADRAVADFALAGGRADRGDPSRATGGAMPAPRDSRSPTGRAAGSRPRRIAPTR